MIKSISLSLFYFLLILFVVSSCTIDDEISTDPSYKLGFSTDTIMFDTVFTTVGSTTRFLKVYNRNDNKINITKIGLAGGNNSQFELNINGEPQSSVSNIELLKGDSLFIFIKVTVDPTNQNTPMVLTDSIVFSTNGNIQDVDLVAWGQDAYYYVGNKHIDSLNYPYSIVAGENENIFWEDDKPHVVYGWAVVDSAGILNIGPGTDIHFHQNSGLWVYRGGNIQVNGEKDSLVVFQGDRLEQEYQDLPGQWDRIWINEGSVDNVFNYAVIKNGFIGIQAETLDSYLGNKLIIKNTVVKNMTAFGLFSFAYGVTSVNSVYANCAAHAFLGVGGVFDFRHCTFANYWSGSIRQVQSFVLANTYEFGSGFIIQSNLADAFFGNCIVYGNLDDEFYFSKTDDLDFIFKFQNCNLKTEMDISNTDLFVDCQKNTDPLFVDYTIDNYRIDTLSPVIDAGNMEVVNQSQIDIANDLDGNSRISDNGPDLGAYEFVPE
ncbi:MAG: hypothetical protein GXO89_02010 [Chlorobi bacterium]|nr:hypothetical protein [Chlorobiota bacterium]